jgi:hypothetical protein
MVTHPGNKYPRKILAESHWNEFVPKFPATVVAFPLLFRGTKSPLSAFAMALWSLAGIGVPSVADGMFVVPISNLS